MDIGYQGRDIKKLEALGVCYNCLKMCSPGDFPLDGGRATRRALLGWWDWELRWYCKGAAATKLPESSHLNQCLLCASSAKYQIEVD